MQVRVEVTTTVTDGTGALITSVTTAEVATIGDNPAMVRSAIVTTDVYGRAESLNLDQVEAGFSRV